jgi:hypothetical protein
MDFISKDVDEWWVYEGFGKETITAYLIVYHSLDGMRNNTTNLIEDYLWPNEESKWVLPNARLERYHVTSLLGL